MNGYTRRTLQTLLESIDTGPLSTLKDQLKTVRDDEQGKLDAIPEAMAEGRTATELQAAIEALDEAIECIESAVASVEESQDHITTAQGDGPIAPAKRPTDANEARAIAELQATIKAAEGSL